MKKGRITVVVTGGCGFIGSHLVEYINTIDIVKKIIVWDKVTYAATSWLDAKEWVSKMKLNQVDVADANSVFKLAEKAKPDIIFHLAAETHVDRSVYESSEFMKTNILGTKVICDVAKEMGCQLIHVSTDEVYGPQNVDEFTDENSSFRPSSPYAASKAAGDLIVQSYIKTHSLNANIVRPANTFGPRQFPEKLIPRMVWKCIKGERLPVYGNGRQEREWLDVKFLVDTLWKIAVMSYPQDMYNIPGHGLLQNLEVAEIIRDTVWSEIGHTPSKIVHVQDRPAHDVRYQMNGWKLMNELGINPKIPDKDLLVEEIRKTVRWYCDNQDWLEKYHVEDTLYNKLGYGKKLTW